MLLCRLPLPAFPANVSDAVEPGGIVMSLCKPKYGSYRSCCTAAAGGGCGVCGDFIDCSFSAHFYAEGLCTLIIAVPGRAADHCRGSLF